MPDLQTFHFHERRRRARGALAAVWLLLGVLGLSFFHAQVVRNPAYAMQSDRNRLRPISLPAARGTILDRNGRLVAENLPGYTVSLLPAPADSLRSTLQRLVPFLGLSDADVQTLLVRQRRHPQQPLVISGDLSFDQVSALEERHSSFPELLIEMGPKRRYPGGRAAAHLVGYVGEISERELADSLFPGYRSGQSVGKTGVERSYEARLAGVPGVRYLEVDALGRIRGDLPTPHDRTPVPGHPLRLTVDMDLQEFVARIVPDTLRGALAALDPWTGDVLALYSSPSFDPNTLVGYVAPSHWDALLQDSTKRLLNRALTGLYPPGSTWKLATAAIGLELGIVDPAATMPLACRGGMRYGNRYFRCWEPSGHGLLNLTDAIKHSCDVYFYQLGLKIGLDRLLEEGTRLGFSRPSGVDLPAERAGNFPGDRRWYERRFGWSPTEAEVLSLAIGQGADDQTVLKMAQFYSALATKGAAPAPHVVADSPRSVAGDSMRLNLSPEHLAWLREGLRRVIHQGGTAYGSALEYWDWAGKTGTAQNPHGADHGWFVGIGGEPGAPAEVVVAVIIEGGRHGSDVAQIAAKAADYYLRKAHGMPTDTIQTLREHWLSGRYAPWADRWQ